MRRLNYILHLSGCSQNTKNMARFSIKKTEPELNVEYRYVLLHCYRPHCSGVVDVRVLMLDMRELNTDRDKNGKGCVW